MLADFRHERWVPHNEPRLRAAEELVAGAGHDAHTGSQALAHRGLALEAERREIHERAAPEILDERDAVLPGERGQLGQCRLADEALHAEVAAVHAEDGA